MRRNALKLKTKLASRKPRSIYEPMCNASEKFKIFPFYPNIENLQFPLNFSFLFLFELLFSSGMESLRAVRFSHRAQE